MSLAPNLKRGLRVGVHSGSLSYRQKGKEEEVGRRGKEFRIWELVLFDMLEGYVNITVGSVHWVQRWGSYSIMRLS